MDLTRREFTLAGVAALSGVDGTGQLQIGGGQTADGQEFRGVALLVGPGDARPEPGSAFFDDKPYYAYIYEDEDTGQRSQIASGQSSWTPLNYTGKQPVFSADDLPDPTNGTHTLASKVYEFNGFVTSTAGLDISNGPVLVGRHGAADGFIHTGGATAITGSGGGYFSRDMYYGAPGGTIFDISAGQGTEMLVESCSYSDAAGLGTIASLGTIDGYRVPSFKGCNFEDFDGGLTFDGSPDKIFLRGCPMRGVTASNVTILTFADTLDVAIVDMPNNYIKGVQSDTEVIRVEAGGEPSEVFQYRGNTHDTSVTTSNVLTGPNVDKNAEPFFVDDSYPLGPTATIGEIHNDTSAAVTIGTQDTYTQIDVASTADTTNRFSKAADGKLTYDGSQEITAEANLTISFYGANGDIYTFGIAKNGSVETQHTGSVEAGGQNANVSVPANAVFPLTNGDTVSVKVKNESGTNDPTILSYAFSVSAT